MEPHRHEGIFIARGKEDALVTKNLVTGESVYGEKRVSVEARFLLLQGQLAVQTACTGISSANCGISGTNSPGHLESLQPSLQLRFHAVPAWPDLIHKTQSGSHTRAAWPMPHVMQTDGEKTEYRLWNPFRSKLAAAVLAGLDNIYIKPGAKVLYLGAASGTSVSHVSDIVGPQGALA